MENEFCFEIFVKWNFDQSQRCNIERVFDLKTTKELTNK